MKVFAKSIVPCLISCLSLVANVDGQAQDVREKFSNYRKTAAQEKVYLHTDRDVYITGETLQLSAYVVDASMNKPSDISRIAYVELIDNANVSLVQAKVDLKGGRGGASLYIPATLSSGNYVLRSYTRWMKNFNPEYFFQKTISIVNTFVKMDPAVKGIAAFDAQFFPEGGNWIAGAEGKVAFKVTNADGRSFPFHGALVDDSNDTLVRFQPYRFGMGNFTFKPQAGKKYKAVVAADGKRQVFELPAVTNAGYSLTLKQEGKIIRVEVRAHQTPTSSIYLFAHARQIIAKAELKPMSDNTAVFEIGIDELPDGITHFTAFNSGQVPVCERLFFKVPSKTLSLKAKTNSNQFNTRSEVQLDVQTPTAASASISVFQLDSLADNPSDRILEYLWLTSDLRGAIESPGFYFTASDEARQAADNLMLTQGWRRFKWSEVLSAPPSFTYLPENHGHLMEGLVRNARGDTAALVLTYLTSPDKIVNTYASRSDKKGMVLFDLRNLYGPRRLIAYNDSTYKVEFSSPFSKATTTRSLPPLHLSTATEKNLLARSVGMQVQDIYVDEHIKPVNFDSISFYGKADETYLLDDYTRFPVMEEVLREYVPGVMVRKNKEGFYFMILNQVTGKLFNSPVILLDGVPISDVDKIMAFDPLRISKLEVVKKTFFNGLSAFPGLVSFTSYDGDLGGFELDKHYVSIDYDGLNLQREVYAPNYGKQAMSNIPDPRTLLYWSSSIELKDGAPTQVKFYTSDMTGTFMVVVDGLADNGTAGSAFYQFNVKR